MIGLIVILAFLVGGGFWNLFCSPNTMLNAYRWAIRNGENAEASRTLVVHTRVSGAVMLTMAFALPVLLLVPLGDPTEKDTGPEVEITYRPQTTRDLDRRWDLKLPTSIVMNDRPYDWEAYGTLTPTELPVVPSPATALASDETYVPLYRYAIDSDPVIGVGTSVGALPGDLVVGALPPFPSRCADTRVEVVETAETVTIGRVATATSIEAFPLDPATGLPAPSPVCPLPSDLQPLQVPVVIVHLAEPLGSRSVLDAATGEPVPTVTP